MEELIFDKSLTIYLQKPIFQDIKTLIYVHVIYFHFWKCLSEKTYHYFYGFFFFIKAVKRLVYLGRYEKMCLGDVMKGIKVLYMNCNQLNYYRYSMAVILSHCEARHVNVCTVHFIHFKFRFYLIKVSLFIFWVLHSAYIVQLWQVG